MPNRRSKSASLSVSALFESIFRRFSFEHCRSAADFSSRTLLLLPPLIEFVFLQKIFARISPKKVDDRFSPKKVLDDRLALEALRKEGYGFSYVVSQSPTCMQALEVNKAVNENGI
jgi:hypothetical protein